MRPVLMLAVLVGCLSAAEQVVINPKTACDGLSDIQIQDVLLGRTTCWADGTRVALVLNPDTAVMSSILKKYAHKTPSQFDAWWKRQVFTGTGTMPPTANSLEDLLKQVASTPGAISFLGDPQQASEQVKVIPLK